MSSFLSKPSTPKILAVIALLVIMAGAFIINKRKSNFKEASKLPFYNVQLEQVSDGIYPGKTYTSFLHLQLEVEVKDHQIKDIRIIEAGGIDSETAKPIIQEMIEQNKVVVPAIKGAEIGSLVYISCVDGALHNAAKE